MNNNYFEAVEMCPHCMGENVYPMWNTEVSGFVAVCEHCGKEILLCDECIHHEDKLNKNSCACDWCETECGGKCFRGETINRKENDMNNLNKVYENNEWFENVGKARGIAIAILDIFEEMLEEKGIIVPDEDRTGDEGEACLYGMTYAELEDEIVELLNEYIY